MKALRVLPVMLALVAMPLSGCLTDLFEEEPVTDSVLARKVTITVSPDMEDARPEDVIKTSFEYRHTGGSLDVDGVRVEYMDEDGDDKTAPLSRFTSKSTLRSGDVVKITGLNLTSDIRIEDDAGKTIAERAGQRAQWFMAEDTPLPAASTEDGRAVWSLTGTSGMKFSVEDVEMGDEGYLEHAKGDFSATNDGTLTIRTEASRGTTDLWYEIGTKGRVDAFTDMRFRADGETEEAGFDFDGRGTMDGKFLMGFRDRVLERVGNGGRVFADGDLTVWDPDHPKSMGWEPDDMEHPFVDESEEWEEESVGSDEWDESDDREETDEEFTAFLERLWGMTLDVGDEFRFTATVDEEEVGFTLEVVIQVTERVERNVGFDSIDTLRVKETMRLDTETGYGAGKYDLASFTTWLATDSYLPVYAQLTYTKSYDEKDIRSLFGVIEEEIPFELPEDLQFSISSEAVLKLEEYEGDLRVSPLLGITGLSGPLALLGIGFAGMAGWSGDEEGTYIEGPDEPYYWEEEWQEPQPTYYPRPTSNSTQPCYYDQDKGWVCPPY